MSLEKILDSIQSAAQDQVNQIEEGTRVRQEDILGLARREAELILAASCTESNLQAGRQRARIIQHARVEALQALGQAREDMIGKSMDRIRSELSSAREKSIYPEVMERLTKEALDELAGSAQGEAHISIDPRDRDLVSRIVAGMELDLPVSCNLDCWGGLIVTSQDGKVIVTNTLESRLERAATFLRGYLAAMFEQSALPDETEPKPVLEDA